MYLDGLIFDQMTGEVFYYYYEDNKIEILKDILKQNNKFNKNVDCKFIKNSMTKEDHRKAVLKIKEDIKPNKILKATKGHL